MLQIGFLCLTQSAFGDEKLIITSVWRENYAFFFPKCIIKFCLVVSLCFLLSCYIESFLSSTSASTGSEEIAKE